MKTIFTLVLLMSGFAQAQVNLAPTDKFTVDGRVKRSLTMTLAALDSFAMKSLPDVVITDHTGNKRQILTRLKGILLKDILSRVELDAENPKVLSAYYFVLAAPDNYKLVFSWNELFNSETGNHVYVVMEEGGKRINQINNRISIVTMTDIQTGRRHMSNIERIIVERAK
ncbi:MAG TPA: hypothetical protein VKR32_15115 [Puia sp.]|nr:hypothetical protein [Puia sp.]